jgi:hypothetical protein
MEKIIELEGKKLKFKATGATPIFYKNKFGNDLLVDLQNVTTHFKGKDTLPPEVLEKFGQIAYTMHKQGDPEQPDDFIEWLDQFEMFSIVEILPQILDLWALNSAQMSKPKKEGAR